VTTESVIKTWGIKACSYGTVRWKQRGPQADAKQSIVKSIGWQQRKPKTETATKDNIFFRY
jgi:hypothetical protein